MSYFVQLPLITESYMQNIPKLTFGKGILGPEHLEFYITKDKLIKQPVCSLKLFLLFCRYTVFVYELREFNDFLGLLFNDQSCFF